MRIFSIFNVVVIEINHMIVFDYFLVNLNSKPFFATIVVIITAVIVIEAYCKYTITTAMEFIELVVSLVGLVAAVTMKVVAIATHLSKITAIVAATVNQ